MPDRRQPHVSIVGVSCSESDLFGSFWFGPVSHAYLASCSNRIICLCMRLTAKRRELRLACCVIEGLKGVECWWLKAKWLELNSLGFSK